MDIITPSVKCLFLTTKKQNILLKATKNNEK